MRTYKIMRSKKVRVSIAAIFAVFIASMFVFKMLDQPTITSYKDEQYFIYDCSRPIKAKQGSVPSLMGGRIETLVPADQNEAKRYCEVAGIE